MRAAHQPGWLLSGGARRIDRSTSRMSRRPHRAIVMSSSRRMISRHSVTPGPPQRAEAVEERAADEHALGAQGHRLQHVLAGADAAVHQHLDPVADRVDDLGQRPRSTRGAPSSCRPPWFDTTSDWPPSRPPAPRPRRPGRPSGSACPPSGRGCGARRPNRGAGRIAAPSRRRSSGCRRRPRRGRRCCRTSRRRVRSMCQHQRGLVIRSRTVAAVKRGGCRQAVADVLVPLAEDLQIQRQHQRGTARGLGAVDQPVDEVAVAHEVELEPERLGGMLGHVLDASRCSSWTA